ncbi:MAG: hypothetical protein J2P15_14545 [Micromonosporaceae bacterium]|nr:hypothetical protein [Micromonosporaceae bacterium]
MVVVKWAGVLVAAVVTALDLCANIMLGALSLRHQVPDVVNLFAVVVAATGAVVAFLAHLHGVVDRRLASLGEQVSTRLDELEAQIADRNTGFVEGYLAGQGGEGSVVPLAPRGRRSGLDE